MENPALLADDTDAADDTVVLLGQDGHRRKEKMDGLNAGRGEEI